MNHFQKYSESCTDEAEKYKRSSHFQHVFVYLEVFMYWWETECSFCLVKFHWINWLASIHGWLFRSLYSIEYICSYELFMGQWPLRAIDILENCFHRTKYTANDNKIARIAFSCLVFHSRYVFVRHQNRPCFKNGGLKMTLRIKSDLFLCYFHRVGITLKLQRWLVFRTPF